MLRALAIVASIATIMALDIPEYRENIFHARSFTDNSRTTRAEVINAYLPMLLERALDREIDAVSFYIERLDPREDAIKENDPICGDYLGINLPGDSIFCKADIIQVRFRQRDFVSNNLNSLSIVMRFAYDTERPLALEVPVFKTPSQYASADPDGLTTWAAQQRVGITSPFNHKQLENILHNRRNISTDFKWLDALLKYGLHKSREPINIIEEGIERRIERYVTRPILLPDDILEKLKGAFSWSSEDEAAKDSVSLLVRPR